MKLSLVYRPSLPASDCPYRLVDEQGQELTWANAFLDAQRVRQLSLRSLRAYAFDLLHFARWWTQLPPQPLTEIHDSTLLDYVRSQLHQQPPPAPATVNRRLILVHCLYRFHCGREISPGQHYFQRLYTRRPPLGYGRPRRAVAHGLRLRQPHRVIVPLSAAQVAQFWRSFRTFRDLAIVGLMLLDGLRSCEVLALQLPDLELADSQMRVLGKGNRQRLLPLPAEIRDVLENYLHLERPRTLFRHHRLRTRIQQASPHRFRHTFGADMVRDGISLPALQHLMGHAQIHTTMLYVQLAPQDVWGEYRRAIEKRSQLDTSQN
jgi:integrase/recombinase XerD